MEIVNPSITIIHQQFAPASSTLNILVLAVPFHFGLQSVYFNIPQVENFMQYAEQANRCLLGKRDMLANLCRAYQRRLLYTELPKSAFPCYLHFLQHFQA